VSGGAATDVVECERGGGGGVRSGIYTGDRQEFIP